MPFRLVSSSCKICFKAQIIVSKGTKIKVFCENNAYFDSLLAYIVTSGLFIREHKHARFWDAYGNRKRTFRALGLFYLLDFYTTHQLLSNVNVVVWRQVKIENSSFPVAFRDSKMRPCLSSLFDLNCVNIVLLFKHEYHIELGPGFLQRLS